MKVRTDFVTNSSSSSFVIWGIDLNEVKNKIKISDEELEEKYDGQIREYVLTLIEDTVLECGNASYEFDEVWLGITPESMRQNFGDRKMSEIYQIVADEINKKFGTKIKAKDVGYIEESSANG